MNEKTVKQQIMDKCIHFNGISSGKCQKGVRYDSVREVLTRPYKWPCFKNSPIAGEILECAHREFPSEMYADNMITEIAQRASWVAVAMEKVKEQIKAGKPRGSISCPRCGGKLRYAKAAINGHTNAHCETPGCEIGWRG